MFCHFIIKFYLLDYTKNIKAKKVFKVLKELLGSDLAHHEDPSIAVNISGLDQAKKLFI